MNREDQLQMYTVLTNLRGLLRQAEKSFLEIGAILYKVRANDSWRGQFDSYESFLEEARISKSIASVLVKVYTFFILGGGKTFDQLAGLGYSKLYEAIPLLEAGEDIETVVAKVKMLTRSEIKQEVREDFHKDCDHHKTITICAECKIRML